MTKGLLRLWGFSAVIWAAAIGAFVWLNLPIPVHLTVSDLLSVESLNILAGLSKGRTAPSETPQDRLKNKGKAEADMSLKDFRFYWEKEEAISQSQTDQVPIANKDIGGQFQFYLDPLADQVPIVKLANGEEIRLSPSTTEEDIQFFTRECNGIICTKMKELQYQFIGQAFLVWFGTSFAVLALGYAIRWVYRGFRE